MIYFKFDEKSDEMVSKIPAIKGSRFFIYLWQKYGKSLKDNVVSVDMIFTIWSKICEKLDARNQEFLNCKMQLKKIDKYIKMFQKDYKALEEEFMLLSHFFNGTTTHLDEVQKKLDDVMNKVKSYRELFDTRQAAQAILELRDALHLEGDFSEVERIEKVRAYIYFILCLLQEMCRISINTALRFDTTGQVYCICLHI